MQSIQYPISLPPDFDMKSIETRVSQCAHAFESVAGLRLKAFLMTSIAEGAGKNTYAPFYVWDSANALLDFLSGDLFGAVIDSFGRPALVNWQVLDFAVGDRSAKPGIATFATVAYDRTVRPLEE